MTTLSWESLGEQAQAYCAWRTISYKKNLKLPEGQVVEEFRLPDRSRMGVCGTNGEPKHQLPLGQCRGALM